MDGNYPDEEELAELREWRHGQGIRSECERLLGLAQALWIYPDRFVRISRNRFYVSTGGWSGHEDVIGALQENFIFWSQCWERHNRGGHFWFRLPRAARPTKERGGE